MYDHAVKHGWHQQLVQIVRAERAVVYGSGELLIEAMRTPEAKLRRRLVTLILESVTSRLRPMGYQHAKEVLTEVRRSHVAWLAHNPDKRSEAAALDRARRLWSRLKRNPEYIPWGMVANAGLLHSALGSGREGQKARRALVTKRLEPDVLDMLGDARPTLEKVVEAMPSQERHWRVVGGALWWDALRGDPQLADMKTWISGYLLPSDEISRAAWMQFWCTEVQMTSVPTHVAWMLTEYHQTDPGIKLATSNALDVLHAPYLLGLDLVITADLGFAKVLESVRGEVGHPMARVAVFDPKALDPEAELRSIIHQGDLAVP